MAVVLKSCGFIIANYKRLKLKDLKGNADAVAKEADFGKSAQNGKPGVKGHIEIRPRCDTR